MDEAQATTQPTSNFFPGTDIEIPQLRKTRSMISRVEIKIFEPWNVKSKTARIRSPRGKVGTEGYALSLCYQVAGELMQKLPDHRYKCIEVGNGKFNFVWEGTRAHQDIDVGKDQGAVHGRREDTVARSENRGDDLSSR